MSQQIAALLYSNAKCRLFFFWHLHYFQIFYLNKKLKNFFQSTIKQKDTFLLLSGPNVFSADIFNENANHRFFFKNKRLDTYNQFLIYYFRICWLKLIFRGKGFRIRHWKKKCKLTFSFGKSHWTKIWFAFQFWNFQKLKRQKYLLFGFCKLYFLSILSTLQNIRRLNRYTKRGLRFKRQLVRRRFGKISQVISSVYK